MNCPRCGAALPAGAARCVSCGTRADSVVATGVLTPVPAGDSGETISPLTGGATVLPSSDNRPTMGATSGATGSRSAHLLGPGQTIGPRYHIIRLLGVGGMGAVYHAWDGELGVAVALKVIRPDMTAAPEAAAAVERRFKRELLLARQVTHKNVVRIHDLGDVDGLKYITMPYVQGSDLVTLLRQAGRLTVERTLRYTRQIVDGLVAAHEAGVVHRDLKPANVMIDEDDQALIMDFGIARSAEGPGVSAVGKVVGTLAYMAPEQAQGKVVDQRADVYALGLMLREMLTGLRALDDQHALADLMQRMTQAPPRLRTIDPAIPEPLDAIVARCEEPDPAKRFQTSRDLAAALAELDPNGHRLSTIARDAIAPPSASRWRLTAIASMVLMAVGFAVILLRRPPAATTAKPTTPVSILVADFDNKTGDPVFDGALEQPLTIEIESASFVTAYPRRDALKMAQSLKGASAHLDSETSRLIAFRDGVNYTLAGTVTQSGGTFGLRLDLVDPDGKTVQSVSASAATKADVLASVSSLASKIRAKIGDTTANASGAETFTASSLDAFHEYSIAQDLAFAGRDEDAIAHYDKAIGFDPNFGRAYSGLAVSSRRLGRVEVATTASNKALSLMERMNERERYRTLGAYYLGTVKNYEKAVENYTALVKAYPLDSAGHGNLGFAYFYLHDFPKALEEGRRAVALNPKNVRQRANLALYAMYAGDFAAAAVDGKAVTAAEPGYATAYLPVAVDAVVRGDHATAANAYDAMAKAGLRGGSLASIGRADLALYVGRNSEAQAELTKGIEADVGQHNTSGAALKSIALAEALAADGKKTEAAKAAADGLALWRDLTTLVPAARVYIALGRPADARAIASELDGQLQKVNRAYGKIVLAEIALHDKKTTDAADLLGQSRQLADVWLGHLDLGLAYVQADHFAEAVSELEACEKRRGEATALFWDDVPTVRYLAPLPYWIGRAREGLGMTDAARAQYEAFLQLRKDAPADPLAADARRRLAAR